MIGRCHMLRCNPCCDGLAANPAPLKPMRACTHACMHGGLQAEAHFKLLASMDNSIKLANAVRVICSCPAV